MKARTEKLSNADEELLDCESSLTRKTSAVTRLPAGPAEKLILRNGDMSGTIPEDMLVKRS